jgi:outer membrane receptor protein involved in Fe transport
MRSPNAAGKTAVLLVTFTAGMPGVLFAQDASEGIQEVLVTASKRGEQSLLDTPMAIQALTSDELNSQNIQQFADYARSISGLAFESQGPGDKKIVIRGLDSTGASTTGVYFDDIVITANNPQDGGGRQPDIRLVDMERVEVLKGPQGTLYGASSMSGTVRMLTNKPDPTKTAMAFNAGVGQTDGASGADYTYDGTVNLPIVPDELAVRVVGYQGDRQGYIDNDLLGIHGVNNEKVTGGRVAMRWLINDAATLDGMFVHQTTNTIGTAWYQPSLGQFVQANNSTSPWHESLDAYNLALNWNVAKGTITASASKLIRNVDYQYPGSRILCSLYAYPASTCFAFDNPVLESYRSNAFQPQDRSITSSELRYGSNWSGPVQLVGGLFYEKEANEFLSTVYHLDPDMHILPEPQNIEGNRFVFNEVKQKAAFGELNYSITDALTITGGIRVFKFDVGQRSRNLVTKTRPVAQPIVITDSSESSATYKGNIQYKFASGPLLYFTYSEGFRSGGNNEPDFTTGIAIPPYGSDTLKSYELGGKGRFFGGALDLDAAVYTMNWADLQQRINAGIPNSSTMKIANVGKARIRGGEIGVRSKPFTDIDLLFGLNATVLHDVITEPVAGINLNGDRVPHVPEFTTNVYADYGFPVLGWQGSARAEYFYVGDSYSDFNPRRPVYTREGDYSLVNLRLNFEKDHYRFGAYVENLTNEIGILTTTIDARRPIEAYSTRPRTFGVSVGYTF